MSSISVLYPKEIETKSQLSEKKISYDNNPLFNSKLFLFLENEIQEEEFELNNQDNNNNNFKELEEMNFLTNELIKELNNCSIYSNKAEENKNEVQVNKNIINTLISLAKDGYEFIPKNYKQKINKNIKKNQNYKNFNNNEYKNRYNKYKNNKKNSHCISNNINYINDKVSII